LLRAPQQRVDELIVQARQAHSSGIIANDDLAELLEWADAAFAWAEEERLMGTSKLTDASEVLPRHGQTMPEFDALDLAAQA
jgi:hypothetical protein